MTVSRVINRDQNVRPATHDRVKAAIGALKYAPNTAARALAGAVQTRISLIYGNPSFAYLSEILLGSLDEATQTDVQLLLDKYDDIDAAKIARKLARQSVDGVILPPPFCDSSELINALRAKSVPIAVIASAAPLDGVFSVAIDDFAAAREMTTHLIELGHRRIGFIRGSNDQTASVKRFEGYRAALEEAKLTFDAKLVAQGDFTYRSGLRAARKLLASASRPTAIFASNDDMAAATVAAAHAHHLEVPKDLSVCGFDDTALATTISPELTTVRQPVAAMARAAVSLLVAAHRQRRLGGEPLSEHKVFAHQFIGRKSDGRVQQK